MSTAQRLMLRRVKGTPEPERHQWQNAWVGVSHAYHSEATAGMSGLYNAAEWTLQLTDSRPIASAMMGPQEMMQSIFNEDGRASRACDLPAILEELQLARDILQGRTPGPADLARGVFAWLSWWIGDHEYPGWIPEGVVASPG